MRRAYSLAEAVISLALLAIVGLSLTGLFLSSHIMLSSSRGTSAAATLLQSEMVRCKLEPYTVLEGWISTPPPNKQVLYDSQTYQIQFQVDRLGSTATSPDYHILRIRLRANWVDRNLEGANRPATLLLESQVGRSGQY